VLFGPIRLVTRRKKNGLGIHFGVQFPSGRVFDITIDQGYRQISKQEFADGEVITVTREIPWSQGFLVQGRLEELRRNSRKYDLLNWNCETFAEYLISGVAQSAQAVGVVILIGATIIFAIAARS
jgi:hypothetical protein